MNQIKNGFSGEVIVEDEKSIIKLAEDNKADLRGADLRGAYLRGADLEGADLEGADLRGADLEGAYLRGADLRGAYLRGAYLEGADLRGADLEGAYLEGAKIEFYQFPSIRLLSSMPLINLPDNLTLELMRRDAYAHPYPKKFDEWAIKGGECPYQNEERFWQFQEKKDLWRKGKPQMRDSDLIMELCKSQGWRIKNFK